jgi:prefoldin subunit 5
MSKTKNKRRKTPERSISEKVNYYKGESRQLRKRIDNLEKRIAMLESQLERISHSEKQVEQKPPIEKTDRETLLKKLHPKYKED